MAFKYNPFCEASTPYNTKQQFAVSTGHVAIRINEFTTIALDKDEYESLVETASIMADPIVMEAIRRDQRNEDANVIPWEEAKRRLGL